MTVHNSYNCGVLGHHAKRLAEGGLLGLCFTHAPASIAPTGAKTPVIGTNPFAMAVFPVLYQDASIFVGLLVGAPFAVLGVMLLRARPRFDNQISDKVPTAE